MTTIKPLLITTALILLASSAQADVVVIANSKSPLSNLDKDQVADIYLGKSTTYPDGSAAVPIAQVEGEAAHQEFRDVVIDKSESQLKSYWSKMVFSGKGTPPDELPNNAEVLKRIGSNPSSIGYVDKAAVDGSVKIIFAP
ncbi:MAG: phosphate ABC transporter substrate-binding protein [Methylobacter sp.]|nr:phosphate ABC transporter substrate-binding protein [Methylobacter sp.]